MSVLFETRLQAVVPLQSPTCLALYMRFQYSRNRGWDAANSHPYPRSRLVPISPPLPRSRWQDVGF